MADVYEYGWVGGSFQGLDAEAVAAELESIRARRGNLRAATVVEESRTKDALLYSAIFHVNKNQAAEIHYEDRARHVMRALTIRVVNTEAPPVRALVAIRRDEEDSQREYLPSMDHQIDYRQILMRRLSNLREEIAAWDEFASIVRAIDEVIAA